MLYMSGKGLPCGKCSCVLHQRLTFPCWFEKWIAISQEKGPSSVCNSLDCSLRESPCIWQISGVAVCTHKEASFWVETGILQRCIFCLWRSECRFFTCGGLNVEIKIAPLKTTELCWFKPSQSPVYGTQMKDRTAAAVTWAEYVR